MRRNRIRRRGRALCATAIALALVAAATALAGSAPTPAATAARAPVSLRILTFQQSSLVRAGRVRVRVRARGPVTLLVGSAASALASSSRAPSTGPVRRLRFRRAGIRTVTLRLSAAGRRAARSCARRYVVAIARLQGAPRRARPLGARRPIVHAATLCPAKAVSGATGTGPGAGETGGGTPQARMHVPPLPDSDRCDFLDKSVCLYPWPNDYFTTVDPSSATGRRLNLNILSMPRNVAGKPIDPTDENRNDGFSPGNLIVTKVPGLDNQSAFNNTGAVPITDMARYADPSQPIAVINAATGQRQPIWSEVDVNPSNPADRTLIIRPARNFDEGARYVVALRNLKDASNHTIPAPDIFRAYRDHIPTDSDPVEQRRSHMETNFRILDRAGIDRSSLYLAWDFTVASERNLSERMLAIRNDAFAQLGDHNLADLQVQGNSPAFTVSQVTNDPDGPTGKIARRVEGTVTVPCYLNLPQCVSGSRFLYAPNTNTPLQIPGNTTTAHFTCQVPRSALAGSNGTPARVSLYGHGLLGSRNEIGQGQLKNFGGDYNIITCATDWIGMACADVPFGLPPSPADLTNIVTQTIAGHPPNLPNCDLPNVITLLQDVSNFSTLTDRVQQGMLNFSYLGRAMIHPQGFASNPAFQVNGHSIIDGSRLFYDGNSQGGIIGGSLAAVDPDLDRAALGVPGMNYSTLLRRSKDFDSYATGNFTGGADTPFGLYDNYPNELERPLLLSIMQLLWDRAEADGYAAHLGDNPLPNTPPRHVVLNVAFGDHQVADVAAETEARTIGARTIEPYLDPGRSPYVTDTPFGIPAISSFPYDGNAIVMWDSGSPPPPTAETPPSAGADPHEHPRRTPAERALKSAFLQIGGKIINPCTPGQSCKGVATDPEG